MGLLKRILLVAALLAAVLAVLFAGRLTIAGWALERVAIAQGIERPSLRVTALGLDRIDIADFIADGGAIDIKRLSARFDLREAISKRRAKSLNIGPGVVGVMLSDSGAISIAGYELGGRESNGLPFSQLSLDQLKITIATPKGAAVSIVNGVYDAEGAGSFNANIATERAGLKDWSLNAAKASADIDLAAGGEMTFALKFDGDLFSPHGAVRDIDATIDGNGRSWRAVFVKGDWSSFAAKSNVTLADGRADLTSAPQIAAFNRYAGFIGGPMQSASVRGEWTVDYRAGKMAVSMDDLPTIVRADTGAAITITPPAGTPMVLIEGEAVSLNAPLRIIGGDIDATVDISLARDNGVWRFDIPMMLGALDKEMLAVSDFTARLNGERNGDSVQATLAVDGTIIDGSIGRISVKDAPVIARTEIVYDAAARSFDFILNGEDCISLPRATFAIRAQNMDAALAGSRICGDGGPLASINLGDQNRTKFRGHIAADRGRYRLGETVLAGTPPMLRFEGAYAPAEALTVATVKASGGDAVLNDLLRLDETDAEIDFRLDKDQMTIDIKTSAMRVSDRAPAAKIAPVIASGDIAIVGRDTRFSFEIETPRGEPLGAGEGRHDLATASGAARFDFNPLTFAPGALQPARLAPVLRGIIGTTDGAADGEARISWSKAGVKSSGDFGLDGISFVGPGLTVAKTSGVNGAIAFENMWPIETAGMQTLTVAEVDFGALALENGVVRFDFPGDETLLVESAAFPWFGGEMAVREATATFTGGEARAPLTVKNASVKEILEYVDIEGLVGDGILNGALPLVIEDGRASFVGGRLTAQGPGRLSYTGRAGEAAAQSGGEAKIAFDVLRDFQYEELEVFVDGPLDGVIEFRINFVGTGEVNVDAAAGRVPVNYNITVDAALLELFNQLNLSRDIEMQIRSAIGEAVQ